VESAAANRQRRRSQVADKSKVTSASTFALISRHDRWFLAGGLGLMIALSWLWLITGAGMDMSGMEMTRMSIGESAFMEMPMMRPEHWSAGYAVLMFCMWWIMMIAMMLPSAAPVILLAAALNRKATAGQVPFGSSGAFTLGYLAGWAAFSLVAVVTQWGLSEVGLLSDMLIINRAWLAGGVLLAAGIWQFTPLKHSCLTHCRSPVHFLTRARRPNNTGAMVMGLHHGLFCLGCCWFLMLLLFVGGVMNLYWIAGLTLYVWLEKGLPARYRISQLMGIALIAGGLVLILADV
jgi:predicted metal-binding membrane protein